MSDDRAAFAALFEAEFERCAIVARRIVLDRAVGDEIAAEAFTRAWVRWPWLRRQASPGGWLVRVTTNLSLDHVRRGRRAPAPATPMVAAEDVIVVHAALVAALGQLPARQRAAVALRYLADLAEADVAAAMGVSAGSVKTHLHRGLARLRSLLGTDDDHLEAGLVARP
jgi:RNA polymerase sigma-70 factor (ECF subfamily)